MNDREYKPTIPAKASLDYRNVEEYEARVLWTPDGKEIAGVEVFYKGDPFAIYRGKVDEPHGPGSEVKLAGDNGSWTGKAIEDVSSTLLKRGRSYTTTDEFENFRAQAEAAEVTNVRQIFRGMIGQKMLRERSLWKRIKELEEAYGKGQITEAEYDAATDPDIEHSLVWEWLDSIRDINGYGLLWFGQAKEATARDRLFWGRKSGRSILEDVPVADRDIP